MPRFFSSEEGHEPEHYAKISLAKRQKLVELVLTKGLYITSASKRLGIKNSTAKLIVKRFKSDGSYFESKSQRMQRDFIQKTVLEEKTDEEQEDVVIEEKKAQEEVISISPEPNNSVQEQSFASWSGVTWPTWPCPMFEYLYWVYPFTE